ncbi:MAG: hypothetical protein ACRDU7_06285, partial [Acidimicrobiia bacterium]
MVDAPPIPALEVALRVVDSVHDHPQRAREQAESLIDQVGLDPETTAVAWWALGLAARQLNDLDGAELALRRALKGATEGGLARRVGQIRSSLALVLLYRGDTQGAL